MRFRRSRRPDERAAERLLDTVATGHAERSDDPVARLLAAAVAPARPDELAGEDAALAAFRAARAQRPATVPARPRRTARAAVWLAGFAVTATAGVAVAAVGLDRSDPPRPHPRRPPASRPAGEPRAHSGHRQRCAHHRVPTRPGASTLHRTVSPRPRGAAGPLHRVPGQTRRPAGHVTGESHLPSARRGGRRSRARRRVLPGPGDHLPGRAPRLPGRPPLVPGRPPVLPGRAADSPPADRSAGRPTVAAPLTSDDERRLSFVC
ncbi:hypothetical protein JD81_02789 [Micromonospora sagamiensis]|uniref:Uncharacterized protein n=1 Tax=Micromonospora sagamiensis TaxID=47875 RepID=A0A562WG55_9ACTN|nr:hypothetical protein JD81_02789 [Micromonospora sagamiensis]